MHNHKTLTKYFRMDSINHLSNGKEKTNKEELLPGLRQEYLAEQRIVQYTLSSSKLVTITAWSEVALETLLHWPRPQPYRALHDLTHPGVGLVYSIAVEYDLTNICVAPGKRKVVDQLLCVYPEWSLALAVVVPASLSGQVVRAITTQAHTDPQQVRTKIFFARQAALQWLAKLDSP